MDTEHQDSKLTLRLPAAIATRMRLLAERHDRSLNGEIVRALREYVVRHEREQDEHGSSRE
jgi:predicted transcriptional regulator